MNKIKLTMNTNMPTLITSSSIVIIFNLFPNSIGLWDSASQITYRDRPFFLEWVLVSTIFVFIICHIVWSVCLVLTACAYNLTSEPSTFEYSIYVIIDCSVTINIYTIDISIRSFIPVCVNRIPFISPIRTAYLIVVFSRYGEIFKTLNK